MKILSMGPRDLISILPMKRAIPLSGVSGMPTCQKVRANLRGRKVDLIQQDPVAVAEGLHQSALLKGKGKATFSYLGSALSGGQILPESCPLFSAEHSSILTAETSGLTLSFALQI